METRWLKEALFGGMTATAFKLGTVLGLGWFWFRVAGCSELYRGESIEQIDFDDILAVADSDIDNISPPSYLAHDNSSTYFYVVRHANICGQEEETLSAAVKVVIDADGDLAGVLPNDIFEAKAEQVAGSKVQLTWYYCPIEQKSEPACFKVYYDNGSGQVDYQNPIGTINYVGRKFYSFQSDALNAGIYLFAIRAEDSNGIEDNSLTKFQIQVVSTSPDGIGILSTEVL